MRITDLGMAILPYSFAAYFPFRWLAYRLRWGVDRLVKAVWYLALGLSYAAGDVRVEVIVTYICFIEAWDLILEHRELKRKVPPG